MSPKAGQARVDNPPDDSNDVGGDIYIARVIPTQSLMQPGLIF
jgi:hypothetical protein